MILVFDLDDTLYDEITFVYSGFKAVSSYLSNHYNLNASVLYDDFRNELHIAGRGAIFDTILQKNKIQSYSLIKKCIRIYRQHTPSIQLNPDAKYCLEAYQHTPKYVVTDGNKTAQSNKANALKLSSYVKKIFITHAYGLKNSKPSPYCFKKIASLEKVPYHKCVYIGDNPKKDFVQIKKIGFHTIRIRQGMFKTLSMSKNYEAHHTITSLFEIPTILKTIEKK